MRFSKLVLPGIAMIATTYGLARFSFGLFLPNISHDLNLSASQAGIISSLFYLSYCFTIVFSTLRTDKIGPKNMILLAGLSALIGLLLIAVSQGSILLAIAVIFAGGSTGLVSPPYGYTISLWIKWSEQGKANTWINSGTSLGLMFTGITAMIAFLDWRMTYFVYSAIALIVIVWNFIAIPSLDRNLKIETGTLNIRDINSSKKIMLASIIIGFSTAPFWTFSKSFVESTGKYSNIELSIFWILIGLFGVIGGMSGHIIDKYSLHVAYNIGVILVSFSSILLAFIRYIWVLPFATSSIFGMSYIFITGVLLVWGVKIFVKNASLGIGIPFLMLALGQVIGSMMSGSLIDSLNYSATFIIYGLVGLLALILYPTIEVKPTKINKDEQYTELQKVNKTFKEI
ncbi:MFS transporter [Staphylococcus gallinarum]|uniref:MFS transporter n=1 Tax=Staphylococcus TaxID=1279 RepID=UPI000D1F1CE8|nr:MFS transporter [Staphylococcus gallinarum]MCD8820622.1 MFS transporter [Staphylococcus gallinarum]PTK89609.1 MFS transporter [Staphylococcus gallinarum]PTL08506.1 MFS transporter [Staphylococcus gallinarum]PTL09786.1 MFS transporter [Staphylococcus gallinarum]RIL33389.1 MFS transporter [Staphylococcus gallinarum]